MVQLAGDVFILRLDTSGQFGWASTLTSTHQIQFDALAIDTSGQLYTTGFFDGTADFDPSSTNFNLIAPPIGYDVFIQKITPNLLAQLPIASPQPNIHLYPNPTKGPLHLEWAPSQRPSKIVLRNLHGQVLQSTTLQQAPAQIQLEGSAGVYLLEVLDEAGRQTTVRVVKE